MNNLMFDHARLINKNFSGRRFRGSRTCCIVIDNPELAQDMMRDGWNVKSIPPRNEGEEVTYFLPVDVRYEKFPPRVYAVRRDEGETLLTEETVGSLDDARIDFVDAVIRPREYKDDNGVDRIKAYASVMHVVLKDEDDPFRERYIRRD